MRNLFSTSALTVLALAATASVAMAQETSSSVRGSVTTDGAPVSGATVTVLHVPSGTTGNMVTGESGAFSLSGLRPGGPYTITVKAAGFPDAVYEGISLSVGQPYNVPISLSKAVEELVVTASRPTQALTTNFSRDRIEGVASVNRDIRDIARQDPFASFNPNSRAVSIAGTRATTNKFSVDGVRFSDNFGLQGGGLPTNRGPVPLDAVEQLSVKVAPYDVTEGDFQGGSIAVVLRSGDNDLSGSAFYTYTDDSLQGDNSRGTVVNQTLTSKNWGAFLSGAIIKDKLFAALSYENLDQVGPAPFGILGAGSVVPGLAYADTAEIPSGNPLVPTRRAQAGIDTITNIAKTVYGYDTLGLATSLPEKDEKYTIKIDYNINDMHRMSFTHIHNEGSTVALGGGSTSATSPGIGFQSYATLEPQIVDSHVFQMNSNWTNNFSTETRLNWRKANQTPVSFGKPGFAQFTVCGDDPSGAQAGAGAFGDPAFSASTTCSQGSGAINGGQRYLFGTEQFSQADVVGQTQYGADFIAKYSVGNHVIKGQIAVSHLSINNVFVASSKGVYYFDTADAFAARNASSLTYQNSITGKLEDVYANFDYDQVNFGVQDSWDITPTVNVLFGIRADLYRMQDQSPINNNFVNRYGFANNYNLDGNIIWEPRASITWRPTDNLTLRAGVGLFNGGAPDVYIGNSFSVAGVYGNTVTFQRDTTTATGCTANSIPAGTPNAAAICAAALNNVDGLTINPLVANFLKTNTAALAAAPVNALSKDFEVMSTWKWTASVDYRADLSPWHLGDGWRFGGDVYYGKVNNAAYYTDLRLTKTGTAPDGRPIYADTFTNSNNFDLLQKNTGLGHSLVLVARANKSFDFGLNTGLSYTFSDVTSYADMGGSTANGTYGSQQSTDPNLPTYGTSDYEIRHDWKSNIDWSHAFFGDNETRVTLFSSYRSGLPYSLTMNTNATRAVFGVTGTQTRFLWYVPKVDTITSDPLVTYANTATYDYVKSLVLTRGLAQGKIIGKNTERAPDYFKIDLHVEQELPVFFNEGAKIKLFADVENLGNLINKKYGAYRTVGSLQPVVNVACNVGCTQYIYSNPTTINVTNNTRVGLWAVRVGARVEF